MTRIVRALFCGMALAVAIPAAHAQQAVEVYKNAN